MHDTLFMQPPLAGQARSKKDLACPEIPNYKSQITNNGVSFGQI
jgi:hypothetical protein